MLDQARDPLIDLLSCSWPLGLDRGAARALVAGLLVEIKVT
jgi:hypothetical protein